ncbi:MAG: DUF952 domain-containing protein [Chloroflexi bacterium]|nr:DUF952 domain-containing protein [Chloroflexota bacterium]
MSKLTYHLVAAEDYRDTDRSIPYTPRAFADEGFIHCTNGARNVAATANRHYRDDRRMYVALLIDLALVEGDVTCDDTERIYPHIHAPLNRDAIVEIVPLLRKADGTFMPPRRMPART